MMASQAAVNGADDRVTRLLSWLREQGGSLHGSLHFVYSNPYGWTVMSKSKLDADSRIVSVPKSACITTAIAKRRTLTLFAHSGDKDEVSTTGGIDASAEASDASLSEHDWILLYLVLHKTLLSFRSTTAKQETDEDANRPAKRMRPDSGRVDAFLVHASYVAVLPDEVLTPLHFRRAELNLLAFTPLHGHALRQRSEGRLSCVRVAHWLRRKLVHFASDMWARQLVDTLQLDKTPSQLPSLEEGESESEWDGELERWSLLAAWRWAQSAHGSRAFPPRLLQVESAPILIPVMDLFNHARQSRVTWSYDAHNVDSGQDAKECATLTVHNTFKAGEQVMNSYGPKSNEDLLACYGFVDDDMLDDTVTLKLGTGASRVIADDEEQRRCTKQHYWRLNQECPESLIAEVQAVLLQQETMQSDKEDETQHNVSPEKQAELLMLRGEALEVIVDLLQRKCNAFMQSQAELEPLLSTQMDAALPRKSSSTPDARDTPSLRPSVVHNIRIYREGQAKILQWALRQAQREEEDVARQIESLLGPANE